MRVYKECSRGRGKRGNHRPVAGTELTAPDTPRAVPGERAGRSGAASRGGHEDAFAGGCPEVQGRCHPPPRDDNIHAPQSSRRRPWEVPATSTRSCRNDCCRSGKCRSGGTLPAGTYLPVGNTGSTGPFLKTACRRCLVDGPESNPQPSGSQLSGQNMVSEKFGCPFRLCHNSMCLRCGKYNIITECGNNVPGKHKYSNNISTDFIDKKEIKDRAVLLAKKLYDILHKLKHTNTLPSGTVDNEMIGEDDTSTTNKISLEVCLKQLQEILEYYPKTREEVSANHMQTKTRGESCNTGHAQLGGISPTGPNKTTVLNSLNIEDKSGSDISMETQTGNACSEFNDPPSNTFYSNHISKFCQRQPSTSCRPYCDCHSPNTMKSTGNKVDLEKYPFVISGSDSNNIKTIQKIIKQNKCESYNYGSLTKKSKYCIRANRKTENKCIVKNTNENMKTSKEYNQKSNSYGASIENMTEINKNHENIHCNRFPPVVVDQEFEKKVVRRINTNTSPIGNTVTQNDDELLYRKIKTTPHITLSRSMEIEVCTLITKIQKLTLNNRCSKVLIKNMNLTKKHFQNFIIKRKSRFMTKSLGKTANGISESEQFRKRHGFLMKILRNNPNCLLGEDVFAAKQNHLLNPSSFTTSQEDAMCSQMAHIGDLASQLKDTSYGFKSDTNTDRLSNDIIKGQSTSHRAEVRRDVIPIPPEGIKQMCFASSSTMCNKIYCDEDFESSECSYADCIPTGLRGNFKESKLTETKMRDENKDISGQPLRMKQCWSRKQRNSHPQQGVAKLLKTSRKTFGTKSSHFYRLFYLCTVRELFIRSYSEREFHHLVMQNKPSPKCQSQPVLCPHLSLLPDDRKSDSQLMASSAKENKKVFPEFGHTMADISGPWCLGDAGSKERDAPNLPQCDSKLSGGLQPRISVDKDTNIQQSVERRQGPLRKEDYGQLDVNGNIECPNEYERGECWEVRLQQRVDEADSHVDCCVSMGNHVMQTEGNHVMQTEGTSCETNYESSERPTSRNEGDETMVSIEADADSTRRALLSDYGNVISSDRSKLYEDDAIVMPSCNETEYIKPTEGKSCETNDESSERPTSRDEGDKTVVSIKAGADGTRRALISDYTNVISPDRSKSYEDDGIAMPNCNETECIKPNVNKNNLRSNHKALYDEIRHKVATESTNETQPHITVVNLIVSKEETVRKLPENSLDRSKTKLLLDTGVWHEGPTSETMADQHDRNNVTTDSGKLKPVKEFSQETSKYEEITETSYCIAHGLILQMLADICTKYKVSSAKNVDRILKEATDTASTENGRDEDTSGRSGAKPATKGSVKKMLELYSSSSGSADSTGPRTDRTARSSEIGTLPKGVVRERREMFARLKMFGVSSGPGEGEKLWSRTSRRANSHASDIQELTKAESFVHRDVVRPAAVVPTRPSEDHHQDGVIHCPWPMDKHPPDANISCMVILFFLLTLCFLVKISYQLFNDNLYT